jgi:hypothetical protein
MRIAVWCMKKIAKVKGAKLQYFDIIIVVVGLVGLIIRHYFSSIEWQMLYSCLGETTFKIDSPLLF